jgi:hypothetical protein
MLHTLCFSVQNALYFIMLPFLVPVLFAFYIQSVLFLNVKLRCQKDKRRIKYNLPYVNIRKKFNIYGSVRRQYIKYDAISHSLFISGNCSTYFAWYFHTSSGAHTTACTAPCSCHTITVICHYRGRVWTGLSLPWVEYTTHSTLKPFPTLPR